MNHSETEAALLVLEPQFDWSEYSNGVFNGYLNAKLLYYFCSDVGDCEEDIVFVTGRRMI